MKTRRPLTENEFVKLFQEVRHDIDALHLHVEVFTGVVEQLKRYPRVLRNFPAFFGTFMSAARTDTIIRLGRVYDPEGTGHESCTLARCLNVLQNSPNFFTDAAIVARLTEAYRKSNPGFLKWHRLDIGRIARDLKQIERCRKRLMLLRHKLYAHQDLETILTGKRAGLLDTHGEVQTLIQLAHDIWNHYAFIWKASTTSEKIHGADDYRWLLRNLRRGMKVKSFANRHRFDRIRERQQRRATKNTPQKPALEKKG